jgi:hypothetical protein
MELQIKLSGSQKKTWAYKTRFELCILRETRMLRQYVTILLILAL